MGQIEVLVEVYKVFGFIKISEVIVGKSSNAGDYWRKNLGLLEIVKITRLRF